MNREVKFRGKRINDGRWTYGYYYRNSSGTWITHGFAQSQVDPTTIGQYIGRKDKNGIEIYEGDIVTGYSKNGIVEYFNELSWDSGGSLHPGFYCKEWFPYEDEGELSYHDGFMDDEVIGNIYESPNLLEGE